MAKFDNLPPSNDEYKGDLNTKSPIRLYYPCRKCGKNIWAHLLNEHLKYCGKKKVYSGPKSAEPINVGPKEKRRLVDVTVKSSRRTRRR